MQFYLLKAWDTRKRQFHFDQHLRTWGWFRYKNCSTIRGNSRLQSTVPFCTRCALLDEFNFLCFDLNVKIKGRVQFIYQRSLFFFNNIILYLSLIMYVACYAQWDSDLEINSILFIGLYIAFKRRLGVCFVVHLEDFTLWQISLIFSYLIIPVISC